MTIAVEPARTERTADDFLALVLADHELLNAEFDAIVAATWTGRRPVRPRPFQRPARPRARRDVSVALPEVPCRPSPPPAGHLVGWSRGRSPPRSV